MTLPSPRLPRPAHRADGPPREDPRPASAGPGRRVRPGAWSDERPSLADMVSRNHAATMRALAPVLDELLAVTR